jgi:pyruvate formate lyase activating enzyme
MTTNEHAARHFTRLEDGRIRCDVCPRDCTLHDGQRGMCFVRMRQGDSLVLTAYGRSTGFCIDPIEKKPLYHHYPGSAVLSFGTAGCNLACKFCQNWDISKSREMESMSERASPEAVARAAKNAGVKSVAFTYNDPTVFLEYAVDVAQACHAVGVQTVSVTAGYMKDAARRDLYEHIDAANVDLKAYDESFYHLMTGGHLGPVLDTLRYLKHETRVWLEITTLLIPGHNDSDAEIGQLSEWVVRELGDEVPVHFTAFHPDYRMTDVPPTPLATVVGARRIARAAGLRYVYTGNVKDDEGNATTCAGCGDRVIVRDRFDVRAYRLDEQGRCATCGASVAGRFDATAGAQRGRRQRVVV